MQFIKEVNKKGWKRGCDRKRNNKMLITIKRATEIVKGDVFVTSRTQSVDSLLAVKPSPKESISLKTK